MVVAACLGVGSGTESDCDSVGIATRCDLEESCVRLAEPLGGQCSREVSAMRFWLRCSACCSGVAYQGHELCSTHLVRDEASCPCEIIHQLPGGGSDSWTTQPSNRPITSVGQYGVDGV